ncbi:ATP-dependent DNA ligase, partial [Escherichia coli]|uniref:non-homologous end-joining DNA ligase LigD n=1 Tax=Escherichia coli TaxID=562 RepID=UPI000FF61FC5
TGSVQWVRPQQLCEVSYAQMTRGGIIRQAVFHGLREDKPAREVTGERPAGIVQLDPALDPGHPPLLQIRSAEALVGAVQMGSIEFHTWNASLANLERPDR